MDDVIAARALHVLAVVIWIGGVSMATTVMLPAVRRGALGNDRLLHDLPARSVGSLPHRQRSAISANGRRLGPRSPSPGCTGRMECCWC